MKCLTCGGNTSVFGEFPYKDFDHSIFSFVGVLSVCNDCCFVRVISNLSDKEISQHYASNCLYSELTGVGVGGDSKEDNIRYEYYTRIIKKYLVNADTSLVDVGCSRGGYLKYLKRIYPELKVSGVDLDEKSLQWLKSENIEYHVGDANNLPFATASQKVLCYFHVLEHLVNFHSALIEATRALQPGGVVILEVPDASSYSQLKARVGTLFWLAMKEHVNHFTPRALSYACLRHGLDVVEIRQELMPMKSGKYYPSLIIVAQKKEGECAFPEHIFPDHEAIPDYIKNEMKRFQNIQINFEKFIDKYQRISFWGIGLEFFNLIVHNEEKLKKLKIYLLDSNTSKQGYSVNGIYVISPQDAAVDGGLICCSYFSTDSIMNDAFKLGWKKSDIFTFF